MRSSSPCVMSFLIGYNALPDKRSREIVTEVLQWRAPIRAKFISILATSLAATRTYQHGRVHKSVGRLEKQSQKWGRSVRLIKHDEQTQFEKTLAFWHDTFSKGPIEPFHMPFGEEYVFGKVLAANL